MMNRIDNSGEGIARLGRNEDNYLAHVAQGEMVVPPVITPETRQRLEQEMMNMGLDPNEYTVGDGMSINPITGNPEFGFLKKIAKGLKKVVKKIAPIAAVIPGPWQGPAIMYNRGKAVVNIAKGEGGIGDLMTAFTPNKAFTGGKTGNIFGNTKEFFTKGADGVGFFGNLGKGIGSLKDKAGEFIFAGEDDTNLFGNIRNMFTGGQQPTMEELADDPQYADRIARMKSMGYTEAEMMEELGAEIMQNTSTGNLFSNIFKDGTPDSIKSIEDMIKSGGSFFGDGKGGLGNAGIAGLAGLIGKMAYDEAKDFKGVPLTPLTTTDQLGRYNIAAEVARQKGEEMPSRVEFGLNPSTLPVLQGGKPRAAAQGGIMAFAQGGAVAMANGGEPPIDPANFPVKNGQIDGPGTETSDDIPAMLSDGEFVMTAKAVKGAGGFDMNDSNGIVTLTPNGAPSRDSGTRVMYKLMEHFGGTA
tara:strand:+ start:1311 stop:2723 length:1413 start_codon:yes stop_codon:yes gene_type:complete